MINKHIRAAKGFTIMETLMAVLVLSIALAGALALAAKGLDVVVIAQQEVKAAYLAQDAIENIRWARDTNCLNSGGSPVGCPSGAWMGGPGGLLSLCGGTNGCYIATISGVAYSCGATSCPVLKYDSANTAFTYATANGTTILPTIFTRSIYIQSPPSATDTNPGEASTTIVVSWPSVGGITRSLRLHEDLLDWQ